MGQFDDSSLEDFSDPSGVVIERVVFVGHFEAAVGANILVALLFHFALLRARHLCINRIFIRANNI